jgi:hypothetical protein
MWPRSIVNFAYVLGRGEAAAIGDHVGVFDPADLSAVTTVAEQEQSRDEWFTSRPKS